MTPKQAHERICRLLRTTRTTEVKNELQQLAVDYPEVYEAARQAWLDEIPF